MLARASHSVQPKSVLLTFWVEILRVITICRQFEINWHIFEPHNLRQGSLAVADVSSSICSKQQQMFAIEVAVLVMDWER